MKTIVAKGSFVISLIVIILMSLVGCGDDSTTISQTTLNPTATANMKGYVYVVRNELLITDSPVAPDQNLKINSSSNSCQPVQNCSVKTDGKECHTDQNGCFEFQNIPTGQKKCDFNPCNSDKGKNCSPVREELNCTGGGHDNNQQWQNYKVQVVPRKRAQHVGQPKQYRINCWRNHDLVNMPTGMVLTWSLENLSGTIDSQGIFTPSAPTPPKFYGKIRVSVKDSQGNDLNNIVFDNPEDAYSEVKVIGDTPDEISIVQGHVTKTTNIIISNSPPENVSGAVVALNGIDNIGITDPNGFYTINSIPIASYNATMQYQTITKNNTVEVTSPSTTLDFDFTEDITITPTPLPATPTAIPPTVTPTTIAPSWHKNTNYTGGIWWNDIDYTDSSNLMICGDSYVLVSTNSGASWTAYNAPANSRSIAVTSVSDFLVASQSGNILKTTNGGNSWSTIATGTGANLNSIFCLDSNYTWTAGDSSQIRRSTNNGSTWNGSAVTGFTINLKKTVFLSQTTGFVCGFQGTTGAIYKSIDRGVNWNAMSMPTVGGLNSLCFLGSNAWSCGNNGVILKSTDTGANWLNLNQSISSVMLADIDMTDANVGWAVGANGTILYTTNGGINWVQQASFTTNGIKAVIALSTVHAWAVGDNGTILEYY